MTLRRNVEKLIKDGVFSEKYEYVVKNGKTTKQQVRFISISEEGRLKAERFSLEHSLSAPIHPVPAGEIERMYKPFFEKVARSRRKGFKNRALDSVSPERKFLKQLRSQILVLEAPHNTSISLLYDGEDVPIGSGDLREVPSLLYELRGKLDPRGFIIVIQCPPLDLRPGRYVDGFIEWSQRFKGKTYDKDFVESVLDEKRRKELIEEDPRKKSLIYKCQKLYVEFGQKYDATR